MTTASTPSRPSPTSGAPRTWHGWHLHVASYEPAALESAVVTALPPVLERVGRVPGRPPLARPWFFDRSWSHGPHVRVSIADLDDGQAAEVEALLDAMLARVAVRLPESGGPASGVHPVADARPAAAGEYAHAPFLPDVLLPQSPDPSWDLPPEALLEPLLEPLSGRRRGAALAAAARQEQLVHASSAVCLRACTARPDLRQAFLDGLELLAASLAVWPDPAGLLLAHRTARRALIRGSAAAEADGRAEEYADRSLHRPASGYADGYAFNRSVATQAHALFTAVPRLRQLSAGAPSRWSALVRRLGAAAAWRAGGALGEERRRQVLLAHLHAAHNRLGLSPFQEAQLAPVLLKLDVVRGARTFAVHPRRPGRGR